MKEINLPLTCYQLKMLLLLGCTALFILSLVALTNISSNSFEEALVVVGLTIGALGSVLGWAIFILDLYYKDKLFRFTCKCDKR